MFRLDKEVLSFLTRLNLTELSPIFQEEEFSIEDLMKLNNEEMKDIGVVKLKHRRLILEEIQKLKSSSKSLPRVETTVVEKDTNSH